MKKISIVIALVTITLLVSCGAKDKRLSFKEAGKYNDYIVDIVDNVDKTWTSALKEEDKSKALMLSDSLVNCSKNGIAKLNNLQPYKKDSTLRDVSIQYLTYMEKLGKNELKEFIQIVRGDKFTLEGEKRLDELTPILDDERKKLFDDLKTAQKDFASKFHLIMIK